jgi:hypothetical protein
MNSDLLPSSGQHDEISMKLSAHNFVVEVQQAIWILLFAKILFFRMSYSMEVKTIIKIYLNWNFPHSDELMRSFIEWLKELTKLNFNGFQKFEF